VRWHRIALLALVCACTSSTSQHVEFLAMGTTVSITVAESETSAAAVDDARTELRRIGREWYAWSDEGELARLNAALAVGHPFEASAELAELLKQSERFRQASHGTFDPAAGGLVRLWGFNTAEHAGIVPTQKQISAWRKNHPTMADLAVQGTTISSERRDVVIDLGAIGKGYAVDRAIDLLRARGVTHAMINAGGNLRVLTEPSAKRWRIAIRHPRAVAALAWLELSGSEGVATSGDYERFSFANGKRIHHLLDPRSGEVAGHTAAVTVVASNATLADAASTAIFVAGNEWQIVARSLGIQQILRVATDGQVQVSRTLRDRLGTKDGERQTAEWEIVDL
jgi:FAD:protein FMN transferase